MDIETRSLANIKAMNGRNLDSSVDGNTLVSGEKADGTFGVFNFFQGIKNFFKGISALGTLASGSRLPVTDSNGNVTYTTMNDINNYVINNALANLDTLYLPSVTDANLCVLDKRGFKSWRVYGNNTPTNATYFVTSYYTSEAQKRITQIAYLTSGSSNATPIQYMRYGTSTDNINWSWGSWQKVATENDLWNYTARTRLDHGQNTSTQYLRLLRIKKGNQYSIGYSNFILSGINAYGVESAILACCINSRRTPNNWKVKQIIPLIANGGGASNLKYTETDTHYELWVQLPSYHAGITITKLDEYLNPDYIEWAVTTQNSISNAQDIPNMS